MNYEFNNGGNANGVNDCVARALTIFTKRMYDDVAAELAQFTTEQGVNVWSAAFLDYMEALGFRYVDAQVRGTHVVASLAGDCIAHTPNHLTAIVGGTVLDTIDTRGETVRGYWVRGKRFNVVINGLARNSNPMNFTQALAMRRLYALNYYVYTELKPIL